MRCFYLLMTAVCCIATSARDASADDSPSLRTLEGRYARIVTDLPSTPAIDRLPIAIDTAVPQWIRFWQRPADCVDGWKLTLYLMTDKQLFRDRGLLPDRIPDFPHGFQSGTDAWAVAQPSPYFTRHLVLHETFHGFAAHVFGGVGPTWFAEGTAEMMATHHGEGESVRVPAIPPDSESVPYWGRFKLIRERRESGDLPTFDSILGQRNRLYVDVEPYAWSWAATVMMVMYPEYREQLNAASQRGSLSPVEFTRAFRTALDDQWPLVLARWQLLLQDFDYGFDIARNRVVGTMPSQSWDRQPLTLRVAADRGWQSSGVRIDRGTMIQVTAKGRYSLGTDPRPWVSEPPGVTVRYHRGHPLGKLLAALVPVQQTETESVLQPLQIEPIGAKANVAVRTDSWLLFRIGDDPSELSDNSGTAEVTLRLAPPLLSR